MNKKIISLLLSFVLLLSVACPVAFADSDTATHTHTWVDTAVSFDMEVCGLSVKINVKKCDGCGWYLHTANVVGFQFNYPSVHSLRALDGELIDALTSFVVRVLGKNASAKKYETGGGSAGTGGVGRRPSGYSENNTPNVTQAGVLHFYAPVTGWDGVLSGSYTASFSASNPTINYCVASANATGSKFPADWTGGGNRYVRVICAFTAPVSGTYRVNEGDKVAVYRYVYNGSWRISNLTVSSSVSRGYAKGDTAFFSIASTCNAYYPFDAEGYGIDIYVTPLTSTLKQTNNITINNNTWNGNIYQDNSTNLTYIYPQYTTINENNETVTNISNNPIIYNNETKQYYTYDTVTNNYYYITYETPTPSPSPSPDPTPTPEPGGDTGDTNSLLDVLVQIRDNMIQGFADIKATLVQGWADLSANFTLAIENLNLNITNIFNKKFPDQSTPETAQPSPSPSPSPEPVDPILPETQNLIIPKMNSNTFTDEHGTWVASGSSKYSDVFDFFHAFDRSTSDFWETNTSPSYLQIEIPDPESYYIDGYIMRISKFNNRYAKDWTLQGSDDGNIWDDLDKQAGQNLSDMEEHKYTLTLRKAYKYYRVNMSNYASSMCSLSHFNLLGYDAKDVVTPTPSPSPPPDPGETPTPTPAPTDNPSNGNTNNFWNFVFPGGNDDGTENGHKGILWALISLLIAVVTFVLGLGSAYAYVFPFLPAGLVTTIHICVLVLLLFAIIKFVRSFL